MEWNHFDENGNAVMVDVSEKEITERIAVASGKIRVNDTVMSAIVNHTAKKGDVLTVARVAGIMGTKQTSNLIPMCHPLCLNKCTVDFEVNEAENIIRALCTVKVSGKTGVEMEALMGVNVALLTIYDMCKAMDRAMEIFDVHLEKKDGGKSGLFERSKEREQC
jgi:molybdenum cofactor biosynthesis protein C